MSSRSEVFRGHSRHYKDGVSLKVTLSVNAYAEQRADET
jgi:hypothetical protein